MQNDHRGFASLVLILFLVVVFVAGGYFLTKGSDQIPNQIGRDARELGDRIVADRLPHEEKGAIVYYLDMTSGDESGYQVITVEGVDVATFTKVAGPFNLESNGTPRTAATEFFYYRDSSKIYLFQHRERGLEVIAGADPATFVVDSPTTAHDKNHKYEISYEGTWSVSTK